MPRFNSALFAIAALYVHSGWASVAQTPLPLATFVQNIVSPFAPHTGYYFSDNDGVARRMIAMAIYGTGVTAANIKQEQRGW